MSEAHNLSPEVLEVSEDFFAFIVIPPVNYFRSLQTKARGVLREDSFLRVVSTLDEAELVRANLKATYGVSSQIIPLAVNFNEDTSVSLSIKRLIDVGANNSDPEIGDLIQYTGNRITIDGVDSPFYDFGKIDTRFVVEHPTNLYYTNSRVSDHLAASAIDTLTPAEGDNSTKIATTQYADRAIARLIDSAPSTLDTLNELAAAINDDADFHATMLQANSNLQIELDTTQASAGLTGTGLYAEDSSTNYLQVASSLKNADSLLDSAIFGVQQELNASQLGAGLAGDGSYVAITGAEYIAEATSLHNADERLDTQAKINADAVVAETISRQTADSALQTELDSTQSGAGLTAAGNYASNTSGTHIASATSLKDADNKLDAALSQETISRTAADDALGTRVDNLHIVASSGSYADLDNKPSLFSGSYADLDNKPSLFSGSYTDLDNKPSLFSGSYTDLDNKPSLFSGSYTDLNNKPSLFSGSYADLSDKPHIPADPVRSNWNESDASSLAFIENKPTIPAGVDLTGYATETYVDTVVSGLVDSAPAALDTLNELAAAINDDANAYTTLNNAISLKADISAIPPAYNLPTASSSTLGGIQIGYVENGKKYPVELDASNKAYVDVPWASTSTQIASDWDQTDSTQADFIKNKPAIPTTTDYTVTQADVTAHQAALTLTESQISDLGSYITGYTVTQADVTGHQAALTLTESQISDLGNYLLTVPAATSQALGGLKVSFSNGNLYISNS
jgi:hypothetical protein